MRYRKEFFDLQLLFARRAAEVCDIPLARALLDYTNLYIRFALGRDFDSDHPLWRVYVEGLATAADAGDWTYRFYLARPASPSPGVVATFGCFSYARDSYARDSYARDQGDRVRLHFENREGGVQSPLAAARADTRRDELHRLFAHVKRTQPDVRQVAGVSWLYNLPAYRRLFPEAYLASARIVRDRLRNMPLWGQFLDRHGAVKPAAAETLRERLLAACRPESLVLCFPLQPLAVEAPVEAFYRHHGLA